MNILNFVFGAILLFFLFHGLRRGFVHEIIETIGMIAAAKLSVKMHYLTPGESDRVETVVRRSGLPVRIPASFDSESVMTRLRSDKKKKDDVIQFVLVKKIGMPFVSGSVTEEMIGSVLEEMKA